MPYCTTCGSEVTEDMLFCSQCGLNLRTGRTGFKAGGIDDYGAPHLQEPGDTHRREVKKGRLYRQWVTHSGLPAGETRPTRTPRDTLWRGERSSRSLASMHILLGICIGVAGTALLFVLI